MEERSPEESATDSTQYQSGDPFARGPGEKGRFPRKSDVVGHMVAVARIRNLNRGLNLIVPPTRAVLQREIHELMVTDEHARPGSTVNRICTLGFLEIERGGLLAWGDQAWIGDQLLGEVVGFDLTHAPNHMNVVINSSIFKTGMELDLHPGDSITFKGAAEPDAEE